MLPTFGAVTLKRLIVLTFWLALSGTASAQCSSTSYGNGAVCIGGSGAGGAEANESSKTTDYSPTAGNAVIAAAYTCADSLCHDTPTTTMAIGDNVNNPEACFSASPHSPFFLIETSAGAQHLQEYIWVCPVIPSGITSFTITCSIPSSCSYMTLTVTEWTGLATSNVFDTDGGGASSIQQQTLSISTSSPVSYVDDLVYTFFDNTNDELMTPGAPYLQTMQFHSGNLNEAITFTSAGIKTATASWTGNDDWYGAIAAIKTAASLPTFSVIHTFAGGTDGADPYANLIRDAAGNFYGTTSEGGASSVGTVFKLSATGTESVLYSFTGGSDGGYPFAGLARDTSGNLYGTVYSGGAYGYGAVFEIDASGSEIVLHNFAGGITDGCNPFGGLIQDNYGNLYGTTSGCGASDMGAVFEVTASGSETVLHSFAGGSNDGAYPYYANLLLDKKGSLYGVTYGGGTLDQGIVYKLTESGALTVVHSFTGGTSDGCHPTGTPITDEDGNFYGTAELCGSYNFGVVWEFSKDGRESVLHNFAGGTEDGAYPIAGVVIDSKNDLYGNTEQGGASSGGTIYDLNKHGMLTLLHNFAWSDGELPLGDLIRDAKGIYGTAVSAGNNGYGTVWRMAK